MIDVNAARANTIIDRCKSDPIFHIEEIQGCETLEAYQKRIIRAIWEHDRTSIRSCHDMGKTFVAARVVLAFGSTFEDSKIITTAPTFNQVKRLLWSEIRSGFRKSKYPLGGEMLTTEWKMTDDWFALGFTSRGDGGDSDGQGTASGFQGFHAKHILILFDEATGIPRSIWNQVEGMLTSANVKFVAIGNPTSRQSEFFKCFRDPGWHKLKLSCFDSPNLIASGITDTELLKDEVKLVKSMPDEEAQLRLSSYKVVKPQLLATKWVVSMAIKWGITHPLFVSKVLGDFPEEDDNVLMSLGAVERAQIRWENLPELQKKPGMACTTRSVGVDCARYGPDKTVITMLEDNVQTFRKVLPKTSIPEIIGEVTGLMMTLPRVKREVIVVDGTGLGGGVVDGLLLNVGGDKPLRSNVEIREIQFGAGCDDEESKKDFINIKAHMYSELSKGIEDLAIMPESIYLEELPTIIYRFTPKGQMAIESKDEYKTRTGMGSPDDSDALAMANFGRVNIGAAGVFTRDLIAKSRNGTFASNTMRVVKKW